MALNIVQAGKVPYKRRFKNTIKLFPGAVTGSKIFIALGIFSPSSMR